MKETKKHCHQKRFLASKIHKMRLWPLWELTASPSWIMGEGGREELFNVAAALIL